MRISRSVAGWLHRWKRIPAVQLARLSFVYDHTETKRRPKHPERKKHFSPQVNIEFNINRLTPLSLPAESRPDSPVHLFVDTHAPDGR
jgi:hypothetical protein